MPYIIVEYRKINGDCTVEHGIYEYRQDAEKQAHAKQASTIDFLYTVVEIKSKEIDLFKGYESTRGHTDRKTTESQLSYLFTEGELFKGVSQACQECSSLVYDTAKHTEWHNKLLP